VRHTAKPKRYRVNIPVDFLDSARHLAAHLMIGDAAADVVVAEFQFQVPRFNPSSTAHCDYGSAHLFRRRSGLAFVSHAQ
jgi:hypothetical protein